MTSLYWYFLSICLDSVSFPKRFQNTYKNIHITEIKKKIRRVDLRWRENEGKKIKYIWIESGHQKLRLHVLILCQQVFSVQCPISAELLRVFASLCGTFQKAGTAPPNKGGRRMRCKLPTAMFGRYTLSQRKNTEGKAQLSRK